MSRHDRQTRGARVIGGELDSDQRRRVYSQNFLPPHSGVIERLIEAAGMSDTQLVVEIGAGLGVITSKLAERASRVLAYEIDENLYQQLVSEFANRTNVVLRLGDVLRDIPPNEDFQVIANIPFGITSDIISWCIRADSFWAGTFITQLEYARKRTGFYERWTKVTAQTWPQFSWVMCGSIRRREFRPEPRVDAAILSIRRRREPLMPRVELPQFRKLVDVGFKGVGGSLDKSLSQVLPRKVVLRALAGAGVKPGTVVAFVSPDQWVTIYRALAGSLELGRSLSVSGCVPRKDGRSRSRQ
jgi:23S rRNA (adenine-N6)-dimethyltransferase